MYLPGDPEQDNVVEPEPFDNEVLAKVQVKPEPLIDLSRVIAPSNPFCGVMDMVDTPATLDDVVIEPDAASEKS